MEADTQRIPQDELMITPRKRSIFWVGLLVTLICLFICLDVFLVITTKNVSNPKKQIKRVIAIPTSPLSVKPRNTEIPLNLVTEKTKIARSLIAPPLYPEAVWTQIKEGTQTSALNQAEDLESGMLVPFSKGQYWQTTIANYQSLPIDQYYGKVLTAMGWKKAGEIGGDALQFSTFTLSGIIADGGCGGQTSYIGYKDGMVRLISIRHELKPCSPPSLSLPPITYTMDYTLSMSDPTSIEAIANYIQTNVRK